MTILDPDIYPRTLEQAPTFGIGVHILVGIDLCDLHEAVQCLGQT